MSSRTLTAIAVFLFASLPASTVAANREPDVKDREALAAKFVTQKLQIWQDRMNLNDWNIQFDLVRAGQLEPKTLGNIHWDTDIKTARISVLHPLDYTLPYKEMLDDMEFTVVHELVHLQLASLPRSDASRRVEEHAVNEIAKVLLKLAKQ